MVRIEPWVGHDDEGVPGGVARRLVSMTTSFYPDRPEAKWREAVLRSAANRKSRRPEAERWRWEPKGESGRGGRGSMVEWQKMRKKDVIPC